jgi:hypothetical protein
MEALLVSLSLFIIGIASALTLLFLALGWALRHISDALFSLALDLAHIREKFRSLKKRSTETEIIVSERGLSGR